MAIEMSLGKSSGLSMNLSKSDSTLKRIRIEGYWDANKSNSKFDYDLDLVTFLKKPVGDRSLVTDVLDIISPYDSSKPLKQRDGTYKSRDGSTIYYGDNRVGNTIGSNKEPCETITIDLDLLKNAGYNGVHIGVNLFDAVVRSQNFGQVNNAYIKIINDETNESLCNAEMSITDSKFDISAEIGELVLENNEWIYKTINASYNQPITHILQFIS